MDRDVKKSSIKAVPYSENQLEHSSGFSKLENEYSDLAYEFNWLLKLRCGYKFDSIIAKAANIVKDTCPDTCPVVILVIKLLNIGFLNAQCLITIVLNISV